MCTSHRIHDYSHLAKRLAYTMSYFVFNTQKVVIKKRMLNKVHTHKTLCASGAYDYVNLV